MSDPTWRSGEPPGPADTEERIIRISEAMGRPIETSAPSLTSADPGERRRALTAMIEGGLRERDLKRIAGLLVDPDPDVRILALSVLAQADRLKTGMVETALQDPADGVRAATVRLIERDARHVRDLIPLVAARRWPLTQVATLEALPGLVREMGGLAKRDQLLLLATVAGLPTPPLNGELDGFARLARAVGRENLAAALAASDEERLGAARLLGAEGSLISLRALAALTDDPLEEIRFAAAAARDTVTGVDQIDISAAPAAAGPEAPTAEESDEVRRVDTLAQALQDPDQAVRSQVLGALSEVNRELVVAWVRDSLRSGDERAAVLAARVAETMQLSETAPALLARGATLPAEARAQFSGAVSSLSPEPETLVASLTDMDAGRRPSAIHLMWEVAGRGILPLLRSSLRDTYGPVRVAALEVFAESRDPSAIDVAQSALRADPSAAVRTTAVHVIANGGRDRRLESLEQAMQDPNPDVRLLATQLLPPGLGSDAAPFLQRGLADADERVRRAAATHLTALVDADPETVWSALKSVEDERRETLLGTLDQDGPDLLSQLAIAHADSPEESDRELAVELAGRIGTGECAHIPAPALQDPSPTVRLVAARALARLRDPAALSALSRALKDPEPEVRIEVIAALGSVDDRSVLDSLVGVLADPNADVRGAAIDVLSRLTSPALAESLTGALSDPRLREPATDLLTEIGPSVAEGLLDALMEGQPEIEDAVGQILDDTVGLPAFAERLTSMNPWERRRAVEAVAAIGGDEAVAALIQALADPDETMRIRVLQRLADLGNDLAVAAVERSLRSDPVPAVVEAAEETLRRLHGAPEPG